ncbi:MAG: hypothetical protein ACLGI6_00015 [Gammaproteobacteria bacterium]
MAAAALAAALSAQSFTVLLIKGRYMVRLNASKFGLVFLIGLLGSCIAADASSANLAVCRHVRNIAMSSRLSEFQIRFDDMGPSDRTYFPAVRSRGLRQSVLAECGGGSNALYHLSLRVGDRERFATDVTSRFQLVEIDHRILLVYGVTSSVPGKDEVGALAVMELSTGGLKTICRDRKPTVF